MTVGRDDHCAVSLEPGMCDSVSGFSWFEGAVPVHRLQVDLAAERPLLELHGLASAALKVDVRARHDPAHCPRSSSNERLVWAPGGQPRGVFVFTQARGTIVETTLSPTDDACGPRHRLPRARRPAARMTRLKNLSV